MADWGAVGRVSVPALKGPPDGFVPPFVPVITARSVPALIMPDTRGFAPRRIQGQVTEVGASLIGTKLTCIPHDPGGEERPRATWSGSDGRYSIRGLRPGRYVVTAYHLGGTFRAKSVHVDTEL